MKKFTKVSDLVSCTYTYHKQMPSPYAIGQAHYDTRLI